MCYGETIKVSKFETNVLYQAPFTIYLDNNSLVKKYVKYSRHIH